jgi:hypothetical protein
MTLTLQEKARLAEIYEPILHYHPREKNWPNYPTLYITQSAMWCNKPPEKDKRNWGNCAHETDSPFPRQPLIPQGSLTVNPAGTDKIYIGTPDDDGFRQYLISNDERELFLQLKFRDWEQGGPDTLDTTPAQVPEERPFSTASPPTYWVDVRDQDTVASIPTDPGTPVPPGFASAMQALYPAGFWLLTFHLFYYYHEEALTECEINSEFVRARRTGEPMGVLHGSYAGDWQAVTALVPNPGTPPPPGAPTGWPPTPISPLALSEDEFPDPAFVGFSRRARGVFTNVSANLVESRNYTFMAIASVAAGEVSMHGRHVKVYVSLGTHNNYATQGNNVAPKSDGTLPFPIEVIDTCIVADNFADFFETLDEVKEDIDRVKQKGKTIGVIVGKILGGTGVGALFGALGGPIGAAIGAIIGLLAGGVAAAAESGSGPTPVGPNGPPLGPENVPDVGPGPDSGPNGESFGLVAVPSALLDELSQELEGTATRAVESFGDQFESRIVDRDDPSQLWWQPDGTHPLGYQGKWGVISERDPFDRRSGTAIPSFEASFINALLTRNG